VNNLHPPAGGWMGRLLDVDLTSGEITRRSTAEYSDQILGGRALAAEIAYREIPAGIDAYDPRNRVIIATGPLTGTLAPTSGRLLMGSLSPRIYPRPWYTHSTLGGWFGPMLKYAGFDALVIHGQSVRPVYLEIREGQAVLRDAADLWGMDARQTQLALKDRLGQEIQVLCIGPAGENRVRFATVQHAEENAAGHSGFGAVWGSKNLKAITAFGIKGVPVHDPHGLWEEVRRFGTYRISPNHGILFHHGENRKKKKPICSQACTFNCYVSNYGETVDGRRIPGQCIGGLVWMSDHNMEHTYYTSDQLVVPAGQNFGMCEEVTLHERCNSLGLDQWFRLVIQPWLIACEAKGIHSIRGYPIRPRDVFWFDNLLDDLAYRRGLGDLLAEDLCRVMDMLEGELPAELIRLGRELEFAFGFPAHREGRFWDEEPLPFWVISAMMYASESRDPTIGTHQSSLLLADFMIENRELARRQFRALSKKTWGDENCLEPTFENKSPVAIWSQNQHILIDSLPLCDFAFPQLVRSMEDRAEWERSEDISGDLDLDLRLYRAVTGRDCSHEEMVRAAERAFTLERLMLARAGRSRVMEEALAPHFRLPCRADGTLIDAQGFFRLLDEYYTARGWDLEYGWPTPSTLSKLGLADAIPEIERLKKELI